MDKKLEVLGKIIDLMRAEGIKVDNPYDFENFIEDNASHSDLFATGRFKMSSCRQQSIARYRGDL